MNIDVANALRAAWEGQMSQHHVREFCRTVGVEVTAEQIDLYYTAREHAAESIVAAVESDGNAR